MNKVVENTLDGMDRRDLIKRIGSFTLGAATTAFIAGCGGNDNKAAAATGANFSGVQLTRAFKTIMEDEDNHVSFLKAAIPANGGTVRPAPTFDTTLAVFNPPDVATFFTLAEALENTGTGAYTYAAKFLVSVPDVLTAAASIGLVEGRHAGFLNFLTNRPLLTNPAPGQNDANDPSNPVTGGNYSMEVPQPPSVVAQRAQPFLVNLNLNGGAGVPDDNFSNQGAVPFTVLNYALLLEYLEKTFYDRNVPRFFP